MAKDKFSEQQALVGGSSAVDLSIPQTKQAQSLTTYNGPVPSYVLDLERLGAEAGLSVRRVWDRKSAYRDSFRLFFSGTRKQASEFSIFDRPERITWPSTLRLPTKADIRNVAPQARLPYWDWARIHRVADDRYLIEVSMDIPTKMEWIGRDVERLEFKDGHDDLHIVYVGPSEALIKAGVVSPSFFPDEFAEDGQPKDWVSEEVRIGGYTGITRSLLRLSNGKWSYAENQSWIEKAEGAKAKERRWRTPSPEEWLEQREDMICAYTRTILVQFAESDLEDLGVRYSADFREIVDAIEVAAQRIRDLKVTVQPLDSKQPVRDNMNPELRDAASAAASDKALQSFLKQTLDQAVNGGRGSGRAPKA